MGCKNEHGLRGNRAGRTSPEGGRGIDGLSLGVPLPERLSINQAVP